MNKVNIQKQMDELIAQNQAQGKIPVLFLHSCCAPCSSYVLEYLCESFSVHDFFYNPNISPATEYGKRVEEMHRLIKEQPHKYPVEFIEGEYRPQDFYEAVRGLEQEPEGGKRCEVCFRMRLRETARLAKQYGADYFATTLTISPLKDAERINQIGEEVAKQEGIAYLPSDFKKKGGYLRSVKLSAEYDLYRQDFCGCVFSKAQAEQERRNRHE